MKISYQTVLLALIYHVHTVLSGDCSGAEGECVHYYCGADCDAPGELGSYVPTCEGNCFQFNSFDSLFVRGNGILGTDCVFYSYINCQNEILDTGNEINGKCVNSPGAQSQRCFYNC
ncbi:hypothetical protein C8J56DRAFT_788019 [Mycena floridula]|nr:hypothetical protein C8J56DRAFT_788019 [Mycena floridula]